MTVDSLSRELILFLIVLFLAEKLTRCQQHLHQLTGHSSLPPSGAFLPLCRSDDGHYKSLQCDRSSSVCFCVDNYDGYVLVGSTGVRQAADCAKFGTITFVLFLPLLLITLCEEILPLFWQSFTMAPL